MMMMIVYTFYKIDCEPSIVEPQCIVVSEHFYPINACQSELIIINDTHKEEYSFKYVCTDNGELRNIHILKLIGESDITIPTNIEYYQCKASRL